MSIEDYAEGARRVVTAIACESHRPVRPEEGCPWCEIVRLRTQLAEARGATTRLQQAWQRSSAWYEALHDLNRALDEPEEPTP